MKLKIILIIVVILVVGTISFFYQYSLELRNQIGKPIVINIEREIRWEDVEEYFQLWDSSERKKLERHMYNNNLLIKPGKYNINTFTPFKQVKDVLILIKL